eukprot:TRINITY_DN2007_c0_g3_i3.p1 TRINITY_DN2007_c0_g3~~TRINITY_DN2007_c0_g3_i3.p1  ORF type:complete len:167 (+),score=8.96 TRINITY_DN2007_c0_g3_i3:333-833(+)
MGACTLVFEYLFFLVQSKIYLAFSTISILSSLGHAGLQCYLAHKYRDLAIPSSIFIASAILLAITTALFMWFLEKREQIKLVNTILQLIALLAYIALCIYSIVKLKSLNHLYYVASWIFFACTINLLGIIAALIIILAVIYLCIILYETIMVIRVRCDNLKVISTA